MIIRLGILFQTLFILKGKSFMNDREWKARAKAIIKTELAKQNIDFIKLAELLKAIGIEEDNINLSNKINRGSFSFVFALQIFEVIGIQTLRLKD